ncbi:hypothetical protein JHN49_29140, partial [Streptomyces sp. MBT57]|nr:hypothetical protein [Streptomyces sp. MBT57]
MTALTARLTLRTAVLAAVAAGAVLVPSTAAFARSGDTSWALSEGAEGFGVASAKAAVEGTSTA